MDTKSSFPTDLTGITFGRLAVISKTDKKDSNRGSIWKCLCSCGNTREASRHSLVFGHVKSCGCLQKQLLKEGLFKKPDGQAAIHELFKTYETSAKLRNIEFCLSEEFLYGLSQQKCAYCGVLPYRKTRQRKATRTCILYNGVDRVDNTKGYVENNCVPCCKVCNIAKNDLSVEEFTKWVSNIHNNFIKKSLSENNYILGALSL